jgi:serine-aspartate repeat-containing protein C/D/E
MRLRAAWIFNPAHRKGAVGATEAGIQSIQECAVRTRSSRSKVVCAARLVSFSPTRFEPLEGRVLLSAEAPFHGTPFQINPTGTTVIQAEDYDLGDGAGFHFRNPTLTPQYRSDGEDIFPTTDDGGGYRVTGIQQADFLRYSINVSASGNYDFTFRLGAAAGGGKMVVLIDVPGGFGGLANAIVFPVTGSDDSFQSIVQQGLPLSAGPHILQFGFSQDRYVSDQNSPEVGSLNWFSITRSSGGQGSGGIQGKVYQDANRNGINDSNAFPFTDFGEAGASVFLDINGNGLADPGEPLTTTATDGSYKFLGLANGAYAVTLQLPPDWTQTQPTSGQQVFSVNGGIQTAVDFGEAPNHVNIIGSVIDTDHSTPGNPVGIAGVTVYIDANSNGQFDPGEISSVTDSSGAYMFSGLIPLQNYTLNVAPISGWRNLSTPALFKPLSARMLDDTGTQPRFGPTFQLTRSSLITTAVYEDSNGNGQIDSTDAIVANAGVYLDTNNDGQFDGADAGSTQGSFSTTFTGNATLRVLSSRPAIISAIPVTLSSGSDIGNQNFLVAPIGVVSGTLTDMDNNTLLAGWTISLDGKRTTTTDSNGHYSFTGVSIGAHTTSAVLMPGYHWVSGGLTSIDHTDVPPPATANITVSQLGTIGVSAHNGTAYLDLNRNGQLDAGEPTPGPSGTFTEPAGDYRVGFVPDVNYTIVPGTPDHFDITLPPSGFAPANFSVEQYGSISGEIYLDANADGGIGPGDTAPFAGGTIYIDSNNNGVFDSGEPSSNTGTFLFSRLIPKIHYALRIIPASGYQAEIPSVGLPVITPLPGDNVSNVNFGVIPVSNSSTATVTGTVTNNVNPDPNTSSAIAGWQVYADVNANGQLDPGEPVTTTDSTGHYTLIGVPAGTIRIAEVIPANWHAANPSTGDFHVTLVAGQQATLNFTDNQSSTVTGSYFADLNSNGVHDTNEGLFTLGTGGFSVTLTPISPFPGEGTYFAGLASDGTFTIKNVPGGRDYILTSGPPGSLVTTAGPVPVAHIDAPPSGSFQVSVPINGTSPGYQFGIAPGGTGTPGTLTGVIFVDANADGFHDITEPGLANWPVHLAYFVTDNPAYQFMTTTTDSTGHYSFTVPPGPYTIQAFAADRAQTNTLSDASGVVRSSSTTVLRDIGVADTSNFIAGTVFLDSNQNGQLDPGETATVSDVRLFVDLNNNGVLDPGEPSTVASSRTFSSPSTYTFEDLDAGTYIIRAILPSGFTFTTPSASSPLPLSATGGIDGVNFGVVRATTTTNPTSPTFITDDDDPIVSYTGNWYSSSGSAGSGYFANDFRNDGNQLKGSSKVTFPLKVTTAGSYAVFARWPSIVFGSVSTAVPFDIVTANGTVTVNEDETRNTGQWVNLGTFNLNPGASVAVRNTGTSGIVLADAVGTAPSTSTVNPPPPPPPSPIIVDDSDPAVTYAGNWWSSNSGTGYFADDFRNDGNQLKGGSAATFPAPIPSAGSYEVLLRWPSVTFAKQASNVPVDIITSTGTQTVTVDETRNSGQFFSLGTFTLDPSTAKVVVRNTGTNGLVIADAVEFISAGSTTGGGTTTTTTPPATIVDDDNTSRVSYIGNWFSSSSGAGSGFFAGDFRNDGNQLKGSSSVKFSIPISAAGSYQVYARWPSINFGQVATSVPFDIVTSSGTVTVNEDETQNTGLWVLLGTFNLDPSTAAVIVRNAGTSGIVLADAVGVTAA